MSQQTQYALELEQRLAADKDGRYRAELVARLEQLKEALTARSRQLHDKQTHVHTEAALAAVLGALEVLRTLRAR